MKIFGDNVLSLYICTQTIKGFYVFLLSSFYIGGPILCEKHRIFFFLSPVVCGCRCLSDIGST